MKALIYYGVGDVRIEEIAQPKATGKDVVVKVVRRYLWFRYYSIYI